MENKTNKKFFVQLAAMMVTVVVAILAIFGIGYSTGLFSDVSGNADAESSGGGATLSLGESNGITLTSETLGATNSTAESTHTLTATISPSYATNPTLSWSIAWDTSWSGYNTISDEDSEDVYNDGWAPGDQMSDSSFLANYVTLSDTTGSSVTVSCWQPFGNPIIITVSTTDGSGLTSTCKVDYQSYYTGLSMTDLSSISLSSSLSTYSYAGLSTNYSTGTIAASGTLSFTSEQPGYMSDYFGDNPYSYYTSPFAWFYTLAQSDFSDQSISGSYSLTFIRYSTNWTTFVQELIDGNGYIVGNTYGYSYSDYGTEALVDFYNALSYVGTDHFIVFGFTARLTDSKTGTRYNASTSMKFASLDNYPTYSVASLGLSTNSLVF